jgi:serine phosphatase RsbU (regulator of sigma subunit)
MTSGATERCIVFVCDPDGTMRSVVRDDFGLAARAHAGSHVNDLVDAAECEKTAAFLAELHSRDAAFDWQITVQVDGTLRTLHFAGARVETGYLIMATHSRDGQLHLVEELMRIGNEQTNVVRATAKQLAIEGGKAARLDTQYEELTRLNNEMSNLQRELAKKNAELERFRSTADEEQKVAAHLMGQLVRADMLRDPLLTCWIQPASDMSGDLIAAARTPAGVLHVLLADGTGHGLVASLNVLPMVDPFYAMTAKGIGIGAIAAEANAKIKRWLPVGRFAAAALIALDPREQLIEVWCGGLPPPFLLDERGRLLHEFASMHLPLGVLAEHKFDAQTESRKFDAPGQLVVCSDGVTEAEGADGTQFGRARLFAALSGVPAIGRMDRLKHDLAGHFAGRSALDDISVAMVDCGASPLPLQGQGDAV